MNVTVQVSFHAESEKSIGCLVDLLFDPEGNYSSGSRLEWFPKSHCTIEKKEVEGKLPAYFLTAPEWVLKSRNVKYKI